MYPAVSADRRREGDGVQPDIAAHIKHDVTRPKQGLEMSNVGILEVARDEKTTPYGLVDPHCERATVEAQLPEMSMLR